MPVSPPDHPEPRLYEPDPRQLAARMRAAGLEPWPGSPLARQPLDALGNDHPRGDAAALPDPALACLARPERVLAVATWPPADAPAHWYYGRADAAALALHDVDGNGRHRVLWPVPYRAIGAMLAEPAEGATGAVGDFRLETDHTGLALLAALADALQELLLHDMLARRSTSARPLELAELRAALGASIGSDDLRWTGARIDRLTPAGLGMLPEDMQPVQERLGAERLVLQSEDGLRPAPRLGAVLARWNAADAFAALTERRRDARGHWDWRHRAVLHGLGGLFDFQFTDIDRDSFRVTVRELSAETLRQEARALFGPGSGAEGSGAPAQRPVPTTAEPCTACGAPLRPGAAFCTRCGAPVTAAPPSAAAAESMPLAPACPACGAELRPGARFCTRCGAPL